MPSKECRCIDCGYLTSDYNNSYPELSKRAREEIGKSQLVPLCFVDATEFHAREGTEVDSSGHLPPGCFADEVSMERTCERFTRYVRGDTPKEHGLREAIDKLREDNARNQFWTRVGSFAFAISTAVIIEATKQLIGLTAPVQPRPVESAAVPAPASQPAKASNSK